MRLFSIAPEQDFLDILADAVLAGMPLEQGEQHPPLSRWTILVPTRRAARSLQQVLAKKVSTKSFVLPRIRPFGDVDEDALFAGLPEDGLDDAISKAGQLHVLLSLVKEWAETNPHESIARDIRSSPEQQLQLALSLQQLVNQMETEEADFGKLAGTHDLELAFHRGAVLSLFDMLTLHYPQRLREAKLLSPSARRNKLIRLQAEALAISKTSDPIIAAGSTGTNPATRHLLKVIASLENGAVVFPGFDVALQMEVGPEHPHFSMSQTLLEWSVPFNAVKALGPVPTARSHLAWDAIRPTEQAHGSARNVAHEGLTLVAARDQLEEALAIALRLRQHSVEGEGTAALITPDRALAARVQAALARWHMRADDSAGDVLAEHGTGALLLLLLDARLNGFAAHTLMPLLHHPDCRFDYETEEALRLAALTEIACVRGMPFGVTLQDFPSLLARARKDATNNRHAHPILRQLKNEDWDALISYVLKLSTLLQAKDAETSLGEHLEWMSLTLDVVTPHLDERHSAHHAVLELLAGLKLDARFAPDMTFADAALLVSHHLRGTTLRPPLNSDSKILILGLLEARLVPLQLAILGGLNEGIWPAVPETGPWLNRAMRKEVGLQMPERDIGLTAHDFVQGLARPQVVLTWSERLGGKPVLPSRLILRLRSLLESEGKPQNEQLDSSLLMLARSLDEPHHFSPRKRPQARPDVADRPKVFSVTEVEKLVRDSYHIFAKRILQFVPLEDASTEPDYSLRGKLIHEALAKWAEDPFTANDEANYNHLVARGEEVFAPYMHMPEVSRFWWVRFKRMAQAWVKIEQDLRSNFAGLKTEINGKLVFPVEGVAHTLSARADRIDILQDGTLRLIDYKSGDIPTAKQVNSGFAPQLPLEAVIAEHGGFKDLTAARSSEAYYVSVTGGGDDPAKLEQRFAGKVIDFRTLPGQQFEKLQGLLWTYLQADTAYVPRHNLQLEGKDADYDHLSRRGEWELSGGG